MTLECGVDWFWGVAYLVMEHNQRWQWRAHCFVCLTWVVADNILEFFFAKRLKSLWFNELISVLCHIEAQRCWEDEHTYTDFSRVLKGGQPGYGYRSYFFLLHFSVSLLIIIHGIMLFRMCRTLYWEAHPTFERMWSCPTSSGGTRNRSKIQWRHMSPSHTLLGSARTSGGFVGSSTFSRTEGMLQSIPTKVKDTLPVEM